MSVVLSWKDEDRKVIQKTKGTPRYETLPLVPSYSKTLRASEPVAAIAAKQITTTRASMTAYSTAVGPSSRSRNCHTCRVSVLIRAALLHAGRTIDQEPDTPVCRALLPKLL